MSQGFQTIAIESKLHQPDAHVDYLYRNSAGINAIRPYIKAPMRNPEVFNEAYPYERVLMAYSRQGQGTAVAILDLCAEEGINAVVLDVPPLGTAPTCDLYERLMAARQGYHTDNTVFILKHCERNFTRGPAPGDMAFFASIRATMHRPLVKTPGTAHHVAVAILGMVPSDLSYDAVGYIPKVQCYFAPPSTDERALLFKRHFLELMTHCASVATLSWIRYALTDDDYETLADYSASRSVREIREFVDKVWTDMFGLLYSHLEGDRAGQMFDLNMDYVSTLLVNGNNLNAEDPDHTEDSFRSYAGVAQSHHMQQQRRPPTVDVARSDPFSGEVATDAIQPSKKRRKDVEEEQPQ